MDEIARIAAAGPAEAQATPPRPPGLENAVRTAAEQFEAMFLKEMLTMAGFGKVPEHFGGGAGEAAFGSFLTQEYATEISRSRSIGIADQIYRHMMERIE